MNFIILFLENSKYLNTDKFKYFKKSLQNLSNDTRIIVFNSTNEILNQVDFSNCSIVNIQAGEQKFITFYHFILSNFSNISLQSDDYIFIGNMENIIFTKDLFKYFKHFKKDFYFYETGKILTNNCPNEYTDFLDTKNYYLNDTYNTLFIGDKFYAAKLQSFKTLLLTLFLQINSNSAVDITCKSVLSYIYPYLKQLYDISILNSNFFREFKNEEMVNKLYDENNFKISEYLILIDK